MSGPAPTPAPAPARPEPWLEPLACAAALAALVLAAHGPAVDAGFAWDDTHTVVNNPALRSPAALAASLRADDWAGYGLKARGLYRPLATASLYLDRALLGPGPRGFHAVALALHALAAFLACRLLRRRGVRLPIAALAAALLAAHPLATEAVHWISARPDLLVGLALPAALLAALAGRPLLAAALAGAAPFAKETGALLPLAVVPVLWSAAPRRRAGAATAVALGLLAAYLALRGGAGVGTPGLPARAGGPAGLAGVLHATGDATAALLAAVAWPLPLDAARRLPPPTAGGWLLGGALAAGALAAAATAWRRRDGLWVALPIAAVGPLALAALYGAGLAERYLYLPLVAVALAAGLGAEALARRLGPGADRAGWAAAAAAAALMLAMVPADRARARQWAQPLELFASAVAADPANPDAHQLHGAELYRAGRRGDAADAFERAAALGSQRAPLWSNLCAVRREAGRADDAAAACRRALALDPGDPRAWYHQALLDLDAGRAAEAGRALREALRVAPGYAPAARALGALDAATADPAGRARP